MIHFRWPLAAFLLAMSVLVGCGPSSDRTDAACRNLAGLPERVRSEPLNDFAVDRCRFGTGEMCGALHDYLAAANTPALDPLETLAGVTTNEEVVAAFAEAVRGVEEDMGPARARRLNRAVVDAATDLGGTRGEAIAQVIEMMPGGPHLVTAETPILDLAAIRIVLERAVDICTPES
ncbi:MAG: hypothetical protein ACR2JF_05600 [Iamia sp.]